MQAQPSTLQVDLVPVTIGEIGAVLARVRETAEEGA